MTRTTEPANSADQQPTEHQPDGVRRPPTGLSRLLTLGRPRATRAQLIVALLCAVLGFALVTQVHSEAGSGLSNARESDLVDVLDNLSAKSEQLRNQISDEQNTLNRLTSGTDRTQAALDEAQQRASTLAILAGTVGATGPGIDLTISDPSHSVTADVLLDTLEELRDAGAEAVEIRGAPSPLAQAGASASAAASTGPGAPTSPSSSTSEAGVPAGPAVRLVASSYFVDSPDGKGVQVDGTLLLPPYDVLAIGDPHTMDAALGIPGGVLDTLKGKNATGTVTELDTVRVTALHPLTTPQYARPAASPSGSG